jgi:hypothetical protein
LASTAAPPWCHGSAVALTRWGRPAAPMLLSCSLFLRMMRSAMRQNEQNSYPPSLSALGTQNGASPWWACPWRARISAQQGANVLEPFWLGKVSGERARAHACMHARCGAQVAILAILGTEMPRRCPWFMTASKGSTTCGERHGSPWGSRQLGWWCGGGLGL